MRRILLIEDCGFAVAAFERALEPFADRDISLMVVHDGNEAADFLGLEGSEPVGGLPDLVVLDLDLPHLTGIELLESIRSDARLCEVPVVVVTGSSEEQDVDLAAILGVGAFLSKDASEVELRFAVNRALSHANGPSRYRSRSSLFLELEYAYEARPRLRETDVVPASALKLG